MKAIINILLTVVLQQISAERLYDIPRTEYEDDLKFLKPPTEKSYPLYDFIATALNNYTMNRMHMYGHTFEQLLADGNDYGASARRDARPFMETLRQLEADKKDNCELQRKLRADFIPFSYISNSSNENSRFFKDAIAWTESKISEEFPNFFKNLLEQLTLAAAQYLGNVHEEEVWKYNLEPPMLWGWSRYFVNATDLIEKQTYFWFFWKRVIEVDEVWNVREKPHCKFDLKIFRDFMKLCKREKIVLKPLQ